MVCTNTEPRPSILGQTAEPLELRVCNAPLAGQRVRIQATKCSIGSSRNCTLRLKAPCVRAVHCLILRGPQGTVVRRWAPNTRLNGANFEDALLQPGDRLTIGPIELEVLTTGRPAPNLAAWQIAADNAESDADDATQLDDDARERLRRLEAAEADLRERLHQLDQQQAALEKHRVGQEESLLRRRQELDEQSQLIELAQQKLEAERTAWQKTRQETESTWSERDADLARREAELTAAGEAAVSLATDATTSTTDRDLNEAREQLAAERAALEVEREALTKAQAALDAERSVWVTSCEATTRDLDARQTELSRTEAELGEQRQALEQREAAWREEQSAQERELQELAASLAEQGSLLSRRQQQLNEQEAALASERAELVAAREALAAEQAAIEARHESAAEHRTIETIGTGLPIGFVHDEDAMAEGSATAQERLTLSDEETSAEEEASDEPAFEPIMPIDAEAWQPAVPVQGLTDAEQPTDDSADGEATGGETRDSDEATLSAPEQCEEPQFEEPVAASPAENSGLMERLRAMADWEDSDESAPTSAPMASRSADRGGFDPIPLQTPEFTYRPAPTPTPAPSTRSHAQSDDDEESIEEYMAQLLRRVRGESETARPAAPAVYVPTPQPEPSPAINESAAADSSATSDTASEAAPPATPFELLPRQKPVELTSNLAAMRELANFSAREAIDQSVRNRWVQAAIGKFSVAMFAALCVAILLVWTKDPYSLSFLAAGVAMLITVFWALQGAVIVRNVRRANQQAAELNQETKEDSGELRRLLFEEGSDEAATDEPPAAAADAVAEIVGEDESDATDENAGSPN